MLAKNDRDIRKMKMKTALKIKIENLIEKIFFARK